ncbi:MAG TPA: hypothetical protein VGJ95_08350 [Pseudonocardiaceae bacterium]
MADLRSRGVAFKSLHEALDTTTPGGRAGVSRLRRAAEFIRELIRLGKPPSPVPDPLADILRNLVAGMPGATT